jgi:integrase
MQCKDGVSDLWDSMLSVTPPPFLTHGTRGQDHPLGEGKFLPFSIIVNINCQKILKKTKKLYGLRRTFAGDLLDTCADIATVKKLMGHANVNTTAGYDRRDAKAKQAAVNKLHAPYTHQWKS